MTTMGGNPWGGSEHLWCELAKTALKGQHDVFISYYRWQSKPIEIKALEDLGIKSFKRRRINYSTLYKKPIGLLNKYLFSPLELSHLLKTSKPNHILISMGSFSELEIKLYQKFFNNLNIPFSLIIHVNPEDRYFGFEVAKSIKVICEKASNIFFVSKRLLEISKRQIGYDFPNGKIINNPVNMTSFSKVVYKGDKTVLNMACVGRLNTKVKGQSLLLQVLAQDKWKQRNWNLNIYGKGPDEVLLKYLCKNWNLESKVHFNGHVDDIRKDIWEKNQVLVMPSYFEGLPLALVEAMLCGRTAMSTDVGGAIEILPEKLGFFSYGVNFSAIDKAMEHLWLEKDSLLEKGELATKEINAYLNSFPNYAQVIDSLK